MTFARWESATSCTGGPTDGARALMKACLDAYGDRGATNLGIYNCRTVRGAGTTSCHGEGRACDIGFPVQGGRANPAGHELVRTLLPFAGRIGLQAIVFDRTIWSAKSPSGRPYRGIAPHVDHVHLELTRAAGRQLTLSTVRMVLDGGAASPPAPRRPASPATGTRPARPPVPAPARPTGRRRPELRLGSKGEDVALVQRFLGVTADGQFGPRTHAAVVRYQRLRGLADDGVVGPRTWAPILTALGLHRAA